MAEINNTLPEAARVLKVPEQVRDVGGVKTLTEEQEKAQEVVGKIPDQQGGINSLLKDIAGEGPDNGIKTPDKNLVNENFGPKGVGEKPVDVAKPVTETSSDNAGFGVKKTESVKDEKPAESKQEGVPKREKSIHEQIDEEEAKFKSFLYGEPNRKVMEIEGKINKNVYNDRDRERALVKAGKKTLEEYKKEIDLGKNKKKVFEEYRDINTQLEKYAPERPLDKYEQYEQRIPSYMIKVDEKGHATYDLFYEPPLIKKVLAAGMGLFSFGESGQRNIYKILGDVDIQRPPSKAFVKELRDYYAKAKTVGAGGAKKA